MIIIFLKRILYILLMLVYSNKKKYRVCAFFYGIQFGDNVRITGFPRWGSEAYLITIGNNVTITQDVVFHTHDGGVHVFRKDQPGVNVFGRITIGNNVFIGSQVIILPNITIGDNVVIGSGSIITKNIPNDVVAAGVPCKPIKSIEQYKFKSMEKSIIVPPGLNSKSRKEFILMNLEQS